MIRWSGVGIVSGLLLVTTASAQVKPAEKPKAPVKAAEKPFVPNARLPKATQAAQLALYAEDLENAGKFDQAAAALQKAAELTPEDWALWDKAGWAHLDDNQAEPALKAFEAARKAAPQGTTRSGGLIIAHFAVGHEKEVMELVATLVAADRLPRVAEVVKAGIAAKPRSPEWNFALGYLYARVLGNSARGLGPMEAAVQANPKLAEAWLLLVEMNQELNHAPQEEAAALKYLELAPQSVDAFRLRGQRYASILLWGDAIAEFDAGILKYPGEAELYFQLARVYEREGEPKLAEATYRKLIAYADAQKQAELKVQGRAQLANFQARQQNYPEAELYYREAAQRPDATPTTWTAWGSLLALTGKWDEAAKALSGAADRDEKLRGNTTPAVRDDLLQARYHAAACRLAAGQKAAAITELQSALAMKNEARTSPEMEATALLAWAQLKDPATAGLGYRRSDERWAGFQWRAAAAEGEFDVRGRFSPAATGWRAILQQLQKRYPDCWPADYALARIYAAGGFSDDAKRLLGNAVGRRPDWWALCYALAEYHVRQKDKDEGIRFLRVTLKLAPDCRGARAYLTLLTNARDDDDDN